MKYLWFPFLLLLSVLTTSVLTGFGVDFILILAVNLLLGVVLGYVSSKMGHEF